MKKVLAIVLVLILALSLLTACGGNNDNNDGNNSTTPPVSQGGNDTTPSGNNSDPTDDPNGGTEQSAFDSTKLPENLKVVYTVAQPAGVMTVTTTYTLIKIGDEYYSTAAPNGMITGEFYLKKTGDGFTKYSKGSGESWAQKETYTSATVENGILHGDFLGLLLFNVSADEGFNASQAVSGGSETIAGVSTNKKTLTTNAGTWNYWRDPVTSLFLKIEAPSADKTVTTVCTSWDTAVTDFGVTGLPG